MKDVKGKIALITGAAMGMGKLLADRFGEDGARLILVDRDADALASTIGEFRNKGYEVYDYICDVCDNDAIHTLADWTRETVGIVQILVNNAGVVFKGNLIDQADSLIEMTFDVNLKAVAMMMKAFIPGMMEKNDGHIMNIASASGLIGVPGLAPYAATKWGVIGLSESVRYEMINSEKNVKMTIVCPSYVSTGMFEGVKPPRMTRFMSPEKIVDTMYHAFKKDQVFVLEPFMVKLTPAIKALLPTKAYDFVSKTLGVNKGMEEFTGH